MPSLIRCTILAFLLLAQSVLAADQARRAPRNFDPDATDRVIVKFRESNARTALALSDVDRVSALASRSGQWLRLRRTISPSMHALHLGRVMRGEEARAAAAQLANDPQVEFAVPDRRRFIQAIPNDLHYGTKDAVTSGTGIAQQWFLTPPTSTLPAAINAEQAWDVTTGSASVPVAVIDTGVLFDHPDLGRMGVNGGKVHAGYDFIGPDPDNTFSTANDGTDRDADPSDPGDWISSADLQNANFSGCDVSDSSWHGTHVAALIGARSNNGEGVTGIGWDTPVVPLRVLGKCAGYDSDILAAMRWAAGLTVSGDRAPLPPSATSLPANPNAARVINLSLGSPSGQCSQSYSNVITELANAGVLIVVAGGNDTGPVFEPARCPNVLAVAGIRHAGSKVGFSAYGSQIGIAAPAGNCVELTGACRRPIVSASNFGTTQPSTHAYDGTLGTSFSSPMVAGVAGLMLARNSLLSLTELRNRLQRSARQFPIDSTLMNCSDTAFRPDGSGNYPNGGSCNCTSTSCGNGMLDARRAVLAATNALAVVTGPGTAGLNQIVNLKGDSNGNESLPAPAAGAIATYSWTQVSGPPGATLTGVNTSALTFSAPAAGTYVVRLTVTDNGSTQSSDAVDHTIVVANPGPPTILSNPANTTVDVGDDVTFSVVASGTGLSYQWERSNNGGATFSNITDATNPDYTLTNVGIADDAAHFRVRVSNAQGSVTSASATLSVDAGVPLPPKPGGGGGAFGWLFSLLAGLALFARRPRS
ncbi:MAG TPA: S8 family serine peptidase [Burkholderiaceae bacterium]|nr:S8 family serine peptidase [Burkholderiaceae bacterium]